MSRVTETDHTTLTHSAIRPLCPENKYLFFYSQTLQTKRKMYEIDIV